MEYYYKGEKRKDNIDDILAEVLGDHEFDLRDGYVNLLIEMCENNKLPKRYYTKDRLDFDKIIDDEKYLEEVIMEYSISKINF